MFLQYRAGQHGAKTTAFGVLLFCFVGVFLIRDVFKFISQVISFAMRLYYTVRHLPSKFKVKCIIKCNMLKYSMHVLPK